MLLLYSRISNAWLDGEVRVTPQGVCNEGGFNDSVVSWSEELWCTKCRPLDTWQDDRTCTWV